MKRIVIVLIIVLIGVINAQESVSLGFSASGSSTDIQNQKSEDVLSKIMENLNIIQYNYLKQLKPADYKQAVVILNEIRDLIEAKPESIETQTTVGIHETSSQNVNINMNISGFSNQVEETATSTVQTIEAVPQKSAMDSAAFRRLLDNIESEGFSDDKLRYVRTASRSHYFSVNQIGQLLDLFDFSEEKIECLSISYARVVDDENGFELINKFTYEDDKEAAEDIINQIK